MHNNIKSQAQIEYCYQVANEAFKQLFWSIDRWTFGSWGCSKRQYGFYKDMPSLLLRVSGLLHKGWVYVSLDEARDTYTVTLLNTSYQVKKSVSDIYCDNLGKVIDGLVEREPTMKDDEYRAKALDDSARKLEREAAAV